MPNNKGRIRDPKTGRFVKTPLNISTNHPINTREATAAIQSESSNNPSEPVVTPLEPQASDSQDRGILDTDLTASHLIEQPTPIPVQAVLVQAPAPSQYRSLRQVQLRTREEHVIRARAGVFRNLTQNTESASFQYRQSTPLPFMTSETSEEASPAHRSSFLAPSSLHTACQLPQPVVSPITPPLPSQVLTEGPAVIEASPGPQIVLSIEMALPETRASRSASDPVIQHNHQDASLRPDITQITYSKNQYKRDAALIFALDTEIVKGGFRYLEDILTPEDTLSARVVIQLFDADKKKQLLEAGRSDLHTAMTSARSVESFSRFIGRFREGPTNIDENSEASHTPSREDHSVFYPATSRLGADLPQERRSDSDRHRRQPHQKRNVTYKDEPSEPESEPEQHNRHSRHYQECSNGRRHDQGERDRSDQTGRDRSH
jgi:hypothetical protein